MVAERVLDYCAGGGGKALALAARSDGSGFAHDMPGPHGYSPRGKRCFGKQDWNTRGRTNVIGALIGSTLPTVTLLSCDIDSDAFHAWTRHDLIPKRPSGAVIVMDNAALHKRADTKSMITGSWTYARIPPAIQPQTQPNRAQTCRGQSKQKENRTVIHAVKVLGHNPEDDNEADVMENFTNEPKRRRYRAE